MHLSTVLKVRLPLTASRCPKVSAVLGGFLREMDVCLICNALKEMSHSEVSRETLLQDSSVSDSRRETCQEERYSATERFNGALITVS